jgi:ketosteroid isomerase-like protein
VFTPTIAAVSVDAVELVIAFNAAINAADVERLVGLMSFDHRFVDSSGGVVAGREACREAWASFFACFPDYRNVFDEISVVAPGRVLIDGRSECEFPPLHGPARWHVIVEGPFIVEWRVEDPAQPL